MCILIIILYIGCIYIYNFIILQHKSNTFIDFIPKYKKQEIKLNDNINNESNEIKKLKDELNKYKKENEELKLKLDISHKENNKLKEDLIKANKIISNIQNNNEINKLRDELNKLKYELNIKQMK